MKLVQIVNGVVTDIIEGVENPVFEGDNITWGKGNGIWGYKGSYITKPDWFYVNIGDELDLSHDENLRDVKDQKIGRLKRDCKNTILSSFVSQTTGHEYDFELKDQINFNMEYCLLLKNPNIPYIAWATNDAGTVTHTKEEFLGVCRDAEFHKRGNIGKYWTLKDQVETATTIEEVEAVVWG